MGRDKSYKLKHFLKANGLKFKWSQNTLFYKTIWQLWLVSYCLSLECFAKIDGFKFNGILIQLVIKRKKSKSNVYSGELISVNLVYSVMEVDFQSWFTSQLTVTRIAELMDFCLGSAEEKAHVYLNISSISNKNTWWE